MNFRNMCGVMVVAGVLAGCAQQEEPTMVRPEPVFDKYGGGSCEAGYVYVPGAARVPHCIPEDQCDPVYNSAGQVIDCLPPGQRRPDDNTDDDRDPQQPAGRSTTGAPIN